MTDSEGTSGRGAMVRSNYLESAWTGSVSIPTNIYTATRAGSVLVVEKITLSDQHNVVGDNALVEVNDGSGPVQVAVATVETAGPRTFVFPVGLALGNGTSIKLDAGTGVWTMSLSCYWAPRYDTL